MAQVAHGEHELRRVIDDNAIDPESVDALLYAGAIPVPLNPPRSRPRQTVARPFSGFGSISPK